MNPKKAWLHIMIDPKRRQHLVASGYCVIWRNPYWYIYQRESGVGFRECRPGDDGATCGGVKLPSELFYLDDNPKLATHLRAVADNCYCRSLYLFYCDFCTGTRTPNRKAER